MMFKLIMTVTFLLALASCGGTSEPESRPTVVAIDLPPVINAPEPITIETSNGEPIPSSNQQIFEFLNSATAQDDIDGALTNIINNAPDNFAIGVTTVEFTVTDSGGNSAVASSPVTVEESRDTATELIFFQETDSVAGQVERNNVFLIEIEESGTHASPNIAVIHQWPNTLKAQEGAPGYLTHDGLALVSGSSYEGFPVISGIYPSQASPVRHGVGAHGVLRLLQPDGTVAWQYTRCDYVDNGDGGLSAGEFCLHHDIEPKQNGNIFTTAHRMVDRRELEEKTGWNNQNASAEFLWVETLFELRPIYGAGSEAECLALGQQWSNAEPWCTDEVWQLDLLDYLSDKTGDPSEINVNLFDATRRNGGTQFVKLHINSISYNESRDEIILSSLIYGELFVFDTKSKQLVYRWGNPQNYQCNGEIEEELCNQVTAGQHDVTWVDNNTVRIHNNNSSGRVNNEDPDCIVRDCSKVIEIKLPLDDTGNYTLNPSKPFGPYPYKDNADGYKVLYGPFSTMFASGAKQFANGDVLLTKTNSREIRRASVTNPAGTDYGIGPNATGDWIWNIELPYLEQAIDPNLGVYQEATCFNSEMFGYSCAQIFKVQLLRSDSMNMTNFNQRVSP